MTRIAIMRITIVILNSRNSKNNELRHGSHGQAQPEFDCSKDAWDLVTLLEARSFLLGSWRNLAVPLVGRDLWRPLWRPSPGVMLEALASSGPEHGPQVHGHSQ